MRHTPVLIVGAGPTGLVLALVLTRRGIRVRVIDDDEAPGAHSRAIVVHARTLEFYRQFGFAEDVIAAGIKVDSAGLREVRSSQSVEVGRLQFGDIGRGLSPYPFVLAYPQDDHERFLVTKLHELGVEVQWSTQLTDFTRDDRGVRAIITSSNGQTEEATAEYVCGCDGAHSVVRERLAVGFPGGTYDQLFYVADVRVAGEAQRGLSAGLSERFLSLMLPVRSSGMQRFIGLVPPELSNRSDLAFEDVRARLEALFGVRVVDVNWFATYRAHHRVAERFRVDRAFLLGDSAHIHSPAGGQGMNTGIGDAVNLGWKLADVIRGGLAASMLDTYEQERIEFARTLVSTTDRAFRPMVAGGFGGELLRRVLAPFFFTVATRFEIGRRTLFRTVSQIRIHYPQSALSEGQAGHVHGGDRLPWTGETGADNYGPLRSFDWQVHLHGTATASLDHACRDLNLPLHVFAWNDAADRAGFMKDAFYVVRPDGYVGLASPTQDVGALKTYVHGRGVRV